MCMCYGYKFISVSTNFDYILELLRQYGIYIYIFYYIRSENIIIKTVLLEASVFEKKDVLASLSSFPVFFIVRSLKLRKEKIFAYTIFVNTMLKQEVKEIIIISCKVLFSGPPPMKLTATI